MSERRSTPRPSVLLVREWEQQMSSSGCCGRLEGDFLVSGGERCFPERRNVMEAMGPLYQELRARFGDDVDVTVIDPRNFGTLFGLVARDVRAHGVSFRTALRTLFGYSVTSVIVNGRLIAKGRWPTADEVVEAIAADGSLREARTTSREARNGGGPAAVGAAAIDTGSAGPTAQTRARGGDDGAA